MVQVFLLFSLPCSRPVDVIGPSSPTKVLQRSARKIKENKKDTRVMEKHVFGAEDQTSAPNRGHRRSTRPRLREAEEDKKTSGTASGATCVSATGPFLDEVTFPSNTPTPERSGAEQLPPSRPSVPSAPTAVAAHTRNTNTEATPPQLDTAPHQQRRDHWRIHRNLKFCCGHVSSSPT